MKKFLLYVVLFVFIAGFASLAYGFWNAKNIRRWAFSAAETKARHNISARVRNIEDKLNASGGKKAHEFNVELAGFVSDLGTIAGDLNSAGAEIDAIGGAPRTVRPARAELDSFYQKSGEQVRNVENVAVFMKKIFDVTSIFDRMKPDTTAAQIREMIVEAKAKSVEIDMEILPAEMKTAGNELKVATQNYLDQFDQYATGKVESHDPLNASYEDFSKKVNDFLSAKKTYFDSFEDLDSLGKKIEAELVVLERVKFSIK